MRTVGAYEAKTHFSQLLEEAGQGVNITITRHGVPVAMLVPTPEARRKKVVEAIAALRELRKGIALGPDLTIRDLIEEGRRY